MSSSNLTVLVLIVVTAVLIQGSGSELAYPRIANGQDTFRGQFTFVASIQLGYPPGLFFAHVCAGVIYNNYWILTVASCIKNITGFFSARVKLGMYHINERHQDVQLLKIDLKIVHENYDSTMIYYDIGLIKTKTEIKMNRYVQQAKLHQQPGLPTEQFLMLGWGQTTAGINGNKPSVLQRAAVRRLSHEDCQPHLFSYDPPAQLLESQICTSTPLQEVTACNGDAGGALIHYGTHGSVVVGLINGILPFCGIMGVPTISTLVSPFNVWINQTITLNS